MAKAVTSETQTQDAALRVVISAPIVTVRCKESNTVSSTKKTGDVNVVPLECKRKHQQGCEKKFHFKYKNENDRLCHKIRFLVFRMSQNEVFGFRKWFRRRK